ncbi:NAD(P)-binding protein [Saccharata proteae CBS 121410]|uniref:Short-chain dehydrogenase/reductase 3 n=1 Tax=Saccharata proteae CBS 121410 TaxID=1314787 RepID=A0A9P4LV09_9PEZI|nr:NAD(P)-binding protein [Saccharata proteae CBS 121410]
MPLLRSEWKMQREGFTADTLGRLIHRTLLNPALTLPLLLAARYTTKGQHLALDFPRLLKPLQVLLALGLARRVSGFLSQGSMNNWTNDSYDWGKEVVVVTGGSDGIGKSVVLMLAEKGVKVAVVDVQGLTYEAPPSVTYFHCDLASAPSISTTAATIRATLGAPTIVINNAGVASGKSILEGTTASTRLTLAVNTLAHFLLAREFVPSMVAANHGMIVTVASQAAYVTAPRMVDYAASKAAALAFHEGLSAELPTLYNAPAVRTVGVFQNYTRTPLFEGFKQDSGFVTYTLEPETVAEAIVRAVLKGRSDMVVLPASGNALVVPVRTFPYWMQFGLRKGLAGVMEKWNGRVVEREEEKGEVLED